jgi:hypothetical protein
MWFLSLILPVCALRSRRQPIRIEHYDAVVRSITMLVEWRLPKDRWVFFLALIIVCISVENSLSLSLSLSLSHTHTHTHTRARTYMFTESSLIQHPIMSFWLQVLLLTARLALARFISMYPDQILRKTREVLLLLVLLASYLLPQSMVLLGIFGFSTCLCFVGNLHGKAQMLTNEQVLTLASA